MQNVAQDVNYPITPHPTWNTADSSKLKTFATCPRMYFFEYVLGWRTDFPPIHTAFGSAIHEALEVLSLAPPDEGIENVTEDLKLLVESGRGLVESAVNLAISDVYPTVQEAFQRFHACLTKELPQEWWYTEGFLHKSPARAALALLGYAKEYRHDCEKYEHLIVDGKKAIELAGTVNVDRWSLAFRLDEIIVRKRDGALIIRDHKTAGSFRGWDVQWDNDIQVGSYSHVLRCLDPSWGETRAGMVLNGIQFNKQTKYSSKADAKDPFRHVGFMRHESYRSNDQMRAWYWSTIMKLKQLEQNFQLLSDFDSPSESVQRSFPMCEVNCSYHFGRPCAYLDICTTKPNPIRYVHDLGGEPPIGFRSEFWNPLAKPANINLDLEESNEES